MKCILKVNLPVIKPIHLIYVKFYQSKNRIQKKDVKNVNPSVIHEKHKKKNIKKFSGHLALVMNAGMCDWTRVAACQQDQSPVAVHSPRCKDPPHQGMNGSRRLVCGAEASWRACSCKHIAAHHYLALSHGTKPSYKALLPEIAGHHLLNLIEIWILVQKSFINQLIIYEKRKKGGWKMAHFWKVGVYGVIVLGVMVIAKNLPILVSKQLPGIWASDRPNTPELPFRGTFCFQSFFSQ